MGSTNDAQIDRALVVPPEFELELSVGGYSERPLWQPACFWIGPFMVAFYPAFPSSAPPVTAASGYRQD